MIAGLFETLHGSLWLRPDEGGDFDAWPNSLRRMLRIRKGQRVPKMLLVAYRASIKIYRSTGLK